MIFKYDMNGLKLPETPFDQNDTGLEMETIEILKKTYDDFEKRHGEHVSYFSNYYYLQCQYRIISDRTKGINFKAFNLSHKVMGGGGGRG